MYRSLLPIRRRAVVLLHRLEVFSLVGCLVEKHEKTAKVAAYATTLGRLRFYYNVSRSLRATTVAQQANHADADQSDAGWFRDVITKSIQRSNHHIELDELRC